MSRVRMRCVLLMFTLIVCSTAVSGQDSATVSLEKAALNAGDTIKGAVTLDVPSPCVGWVFMNFRAPTDKSGDIEFQLQGRVEKGQQTTTVSEGIPVDYPGGNFDSIDAILACDGHQKRQELSLSSVLHFTILPVADANIYPKKAGVKLSVNQKQFLDTKIHDLDLLLGRLSDGIEEFPAMTEDEQSFLLLILKDAQDALDETENQYSTQLLKPGESVPEFFEDFRAHYKDLVIQIKGRKIEAQLATPHLMLANLSGSQLKKRSKDQQAQKGKPSTSLNPDAQSTGDIIKDNRSAYKYVEETGGAIFTTEVISTPDKARMSYRKTLDPNYTDYATLTPIPKATLPMAYLKLKFHKEGCQDEYLDINPWPDPYARIEEDFTKCN